MPKYIVIMNVWEEPDVDYGDREFNDYAEAVSYLENTLGLTKAIGEEMWFNSAEKYTIFETE